MRYSLIVPMCLMLLTAGCVSSLMQVTPNQSLAPISSGESQVVFMRSSFVGKAIQASLFDVTSGKPEFIGIMSNGTKIAYGTGKGHHTFMVVSESADFLEAELVAGKTYYCMVTPRMGAWKARFTIYPIHNDGTGKFDINSADFSSWRSQTKLVVNTPDSLKWAERNSPDINHKYERWWPKWQEKSPEDKAVLTLKATDGI